MCSINGVFSPVGLSKSDIDWSRKTQQKLSYRGPDESREFLDRQCILSVNRFTITGGASGSLPISNQEGTVQVICNGEIYNHLELRKNLQIRGYVFKTDSDIEVILHAYIEYDIECFNKLIGMFAIAIYDKRPGRERLLLARDRMGEKPLFYVSKGSRIFFASEMNVLLDQTSKNINKQGLVQFLTLNSALDNIVEGINRLRPGHYLVVDSSGLQLASYWSPVFLTDYNILFDEALNSLHTTLAQSIRMMLPREVGFGCFISGGLDSAVIASLVNDERYKKQGHSSGRPLDLITSGLVAPGKVVNVTTADSDYSSVENTFNELEYTRILAEHLTNINYHEKSFDLNELEKDFEKMVEHLPGGPVISTSFPLYWFSSEEAKGHGLKSCFCGEGADELFGGYRTGTPSEGYVIGNEVENYIRVNGTFTRDEACSLVGEKLETDNLQKKFEVEFKGDGRREDVLFNRIRYLLMSGLIIDKHMLEKGDGMSMAKPTELRMPYLDKHVLELAYKLPLAYCIGNNEKKKIVKALAKKLGLPSEIYNRPKQRTSLPYEYLYYHSSFGEKIRRRLLGNSSVKSIFPIKFIEGVVQNSKNNPKRIHALYILDVWLARCL